MTPGSERGWHCPPRTILAAVDFEPPSVRAAAVAGFVATATDAALTVLHAERFDAPPYFTPAQIDRLERERREASGRVAKELRRVVRDATVRPVAVVVADGQPVPAILRHAAAADLLVIGTHGRSGPSRWWLGSVAERVVRGASVPVLVTRDDARPLTDLFARVVLVGHGTPVDAGTRQCLTELTAAIGGRLDVFDDFAQCDAVRLAGATLVAVALPRGGSSWRLPDVVTDAIGSCARPVLFVPPRAESGGLR